MMSASDHVLSPHKHLSTGQRAKKPNKVSLSHIYLFRALPGKEEGLANHLDPNSF